MICDGAHRTLRRLGRAVKCLTPPHAFPTVAARTPGLCALHAATSYCRDTRETGRLMSRLLFAGLTSLIARLPAWLGYAFADLATGIHWACFPVRRHAALANLAVILPRASRRDRSRIARRMMRSYNRMM